MRINTDVVDTIKQRLMSYKRKYIESMNLLVPKKRERWIFCACLCVLYLLRIIIKQKYAAITYFLYIYLLQSFLQFISPKNDSSFSDLPSTLSDQDEFKSYQRQLPEFDFWLKCVGFHILAHLAICLPFLDIPVYVPLLIFYCALLTVVFVYNEMKKWRAMSVDAKTAFKYWVGMEKLNT